MDGFEREVLQRLPLAESVLHVLAHVCQDDFLSEVFEQHRGRCYEQQLKFSTCRSRRRCTDQRRVSGG